MVGDFNFVLYDYEVSDTTNNWRSCSAFKDCLDFCSLLDAGIQGPFYIGSMEI